MQLSQIQCTPCQGGIPPMEQDEANQHLTQLQGWRLVDEARKIQKNYAFADFVSALAFANQVGELCEQEGHHADLALGWGYVKVYFQTHKIQGLHLNDFVMAAKVDQLRS